MLKAPEYSEKMETIKILIFGLPGSGKTTLANKLAKKIGALHLNADEVREKFQDWDFSDEGRLRQAKRMLELVDQADYQRAVLDFVCPTKKLRTLIKPDIKVFMDTILTSRYEDTNQMFEAPDDTEKVDYHITQKFSDSEAQRISNDLISFDWRKPTVQLLGSWQSFQDEHVALFERAFAKTSQVIVQVRDFQNLTGLKSSEFEIVRARIVHKLGSSGFIEGRDFIVHLVPNITNIEVVCDDSLILEQEILYE